MFHKVQNTFIAQWHGKALALTNVNSDHGFESCPKLRGMRLNLPLANVPFLRSTDNWTLDYPATGRIFGRRPDVAHPRPESFGPHGHRIDFCESVVIYHCEIKAFSTLRNTRARAEKKIQFFFWSLSVPLSPLSTAEVPPVFPDLIQVLIDLKVTHPSLERLESDSSKSRET